jgi:hypothetical protein
MGLEHRTAPSLEEGCTYQARLQRLLEVGGDEEKERAGKNGGECGERVEEV